MAASDFDLTVKDNIVGFATCNGQRSSREMEELESEWKGQRITIICSLINWEVLGKHYGRYSG